MIEKVALPEPTEFDAPDKLDAFLDAVRWGAASTADLKNIQSPFRSGIEIEDYQLDPVVRAIQMPRVNLLIADDVGLGKTIEAGMVALELVIRHRARKMLIIVPSSLQIQWRDQMRDKFGLEFRIVNSELMRELRRRRGIHANPWSHFPRLITSIDFLKRERPLRLFRERHEESLRSAKRKAVSKPKMSVLQREFDRMDEEYADDFEYDEATADALDSATRLFTEPNEQEVALLKQMKKWADRARAQRDSKSRRPAMNAIPNLIAVIACLHQNQLTLQLSKPREIQYPTQKSVSQLAVAEIGVQ